MSSHEDEAEERVRVYCRIRPSSSSSSDSKRQNVGVTNDMTKSSGSSSSQGFAFDRKQRTVTIRSRAVGVASGAARQDRSGGRNQVSMTYTFDDVFGPSDNQTHVYEHVARPVVRSVLDGFSGTIFAYGQTGSGKTYTMTNLSSGESSESSSSSSIDGNNISSSTSHTTTISTAATTTTATSHTGAPRTSPDAAIGIVPRALRDVFREIRMRGTTFAYEVTLSYVQIYCETIQDLLRPNNGEEDRRTVSIRESADDGSGGVYLDGATKIPVRNAEECLRLLAKGDRNRITAFTHMNAHSSRSHAAMTLVLTRRPLRKVDEDERGRRSSRGEDSGGGDGVEEGSPSLCRSRLLFVDLAGSERVRRSFGNGLQQNRHHHHQRFEELKAINLSLSALGNCIAALATNVGESSHRHVPFRDSKLTRLLQGSLGGNSKTALVLAVSPDEADASETTSTLQFGTRAMDVPVRARRHREVDYKTLYLRLRKIVDAHDEVLAKVSADKEKAKASVSELEQRCERLTESLNLSETERTVAESRIEQLIKALSKIGGKGWGGADGTLLSSGENDGGNKNQDEDGAEGRSTFVLTAIANEDDARIASAAIEELSNRWHAESTRLREQIATQTDASRKRAARLVKQHERRVAELVTENGELELTLRQERETQLRTLRDFHAFRRRTLDDQKERDRRIADLVADLEESRRKLTRLRAEREETKTPSTKAEEETSASSVREEESAKRRAKELLETTLQEDFVGRPVVAKMDHLYNEVLDKLQTRVENLETSATRKIKSAGGGGARGQRKSKVPSFGGERGGKRNSVRSRKSSSRAPLGMGSGGFRARSRLPVSTTTATAARKRREQRSRPWASSMSRSSSGRTSSTLASRRHGTRKKVPSNAPSTKTRTTAWGVVGNAQVRRRDGSASHVSNVRARRTGHAMSASAVRRGVGSSAYSNPIRGRFR